MQEFSKLEQEFDVVIVGGGLVGATLACALAPTALRTALIEAVPFKSHSQPSYDDRVLAIAHGSSNILDTIGVWDEIEEIDRTPIHTIHISDRGHFGATRLRHHKYGVNALGHAVAARALGSALTGNILRQTSLTIMCPATIEDLVVEKEHVCVDLTRDSVAHRITAKLIVFADGADSTMRESLGFEISRHEYRQHAVVASVTPARGHSNTAYERFTDSGPMALLPSRDNRYTIVWTVPDQLLDTIMQYPDAEFLRHLQHRFGDRVGLFTKAGRRSAYPLSFLKVTEPVKPRVVIVGNAAHTMHPVAGQGFNLGLRDVSTLVDVVQTTHAGGSDIGDIKVLREYWQWRKKDTRRMGMFTDGLIRLFSHDSLPAAAVRSAALVALDLVPPLQSMMVKRTMGLAGKLPRLARRVPLV